MEVLIRSVDLETSKKDGDWPAGNEPIEIGWTDLLFDTETKASKISNPASILFAPTVPLEPDNIAVHHLTNAMFRGLDPCTASDIRMAARSEDPQFIVAHNWAFEGRFFTRDVLGPVHPICTFKAGRRLYMGLESYSNQTLRYFLGLDLDDDYAMPPHRAGPDSFVTAHILAEMLKTTPVRQLVTWQLMPVFYEVCPIGKHRGSRWSDIPADYLGWIMRTPDMEEDLKIAADDELKRRRDGITNQAAEHRSGE